MDRQRRSKGFTLAETCMCVCLLSVMTLLTLTHMPHTDYSALSFPDRYLAAQMQAIHESVRTECSDPDHPEIPTVTFNEAGNVNKARTIPITFRGRDIIIELGGGRLVLQ